jgi:4-amino-4-deoxy-L-arabinose transferase-like glycosyltransferase
LLDNERRLGAYVLDAVQNGHWLIQKEISGELASKPPMLTWLAALSTLAIGELTRFAIYLPSALATIAVALLLLTEGRRHFGWAAGFLSALAYLLSSAGDRQMMTARYDGLLALPVTLAAVAAFRAWQTGRGWTWFWLAGAFGTLVKGPLALILGAAGLLAHRWERRTGHETHLRGGHTWGVLLFLAICGGWFLLAYAEAGPAVVAKMFGRELAAHATGAGRKETMFVGFYEPPLSVLAALAPWSLFAGLGLWRVFRQPALETEARRFERFLVCWFVVGLLLFCIAAHQRGRLIFPILPPVAWLAGRELARWVRFWSTTRLLRTAGALAIVVLSVLSLYHHVLLGRSAHVRTTLGMREIAGRLDQDVAAKLVHVDTPFALQFYLNTARPLMSFADAAVRLRQDQPAYVAVCNYAKLQTQLGPDNPALHELARWPVTGTPEIRVVSNRPRLPAPPP